MLVILAGITLNAVIGEDGIIFQAKDTKNMITNETEYDNEQLAALQNELKDNELYSGIGIIPGTDTGGSSEGGESGTGGSGGTGGTGGDQGGSNTGGTNTNTGGSEGELVGEDAVVPTIRVIEGEEIAASFFRSDVTVQISTYDKTQKIKYILTTTVDEINNELYPSGLIKEIDIENGGTLTFTKDGEYTITAYSYDVRGNKSNSSVMWLKRETGTTSGNGVSVEVASGNMGAKDWYTSNVTIRVLGTDIGATRVTYLVKGTAYSNGTIGNMEYQIGGIDTREVDIANGTTFRIAIDGEFSIIAYTYDQYGNRLSTSETLTLKRDASRPIIQLFKGEQIVGEGFELETTAIDYGSDLDLEDRYTYYYKLAPDLTYSEIKSMEKTHLYEDLPGDKTYDMYVVVKDNAGNLTATDVISKPALWISNTPTVGDTVSGGVEGARKYCSTDVDVSLTGQDENNVNISRVTYQILGTTTGAGEMDGTYYDKGVALTEDELQMGNEKTIRIRADGNWTIKIHTYDDNNVKVSTNTLEVTRDTVTPEPPVIEVASGTMGEATYYRSDIDVRLTSQDDTCYKKTTYTVTGTATGNGTIGGVSVTSGQQVNITETDIANGTTFKIQADGRWTVKGYTYDKAGRKSELAEGIIVTRDTIDPTANTPILANGTQGEASYYRSNVTVQMNSGSDITSPLLNKTTYTITGTATGNGTIAGQSVTAGQSVNIGENETTNDGTFTVEADGVWTVTAYSYDYSGRKSAGSTPLVFTRDTVGPDIASFSATKVSAKSADVVVEASDALSGLATSETYTHYAGASLNGTTTSQTYQYTGLERDTQYTLRVVAKDKAGNAKEKTLDIRTIKASAYLVDKVAVGDYVAYNAGTWDSTVANPTTNATFGGYTAGQDKGTSVSGNSSGWRVLSKSGSGATGTVTLISAGSPALGYCASGNGNINNTVTGLNNFASNNFVNTTYASSARNANNSDVSQMNTSGTKVIGTNYWLATKQSITTYNYGGVSSGQRREWFRYNRSDGTYDYQVWWNYYATSRSTNGTYYGLQALNSSGNNITRSVSGNSSSNSYSASSNYYYYAYSGRDGDTPTGSRLYSLTSGTIYVFDNNSSTSTLNGTYNQTYGVRPVVVLKAGILTADTADETYLGQTCWGCYEGE